jgi:transcriptional regulator with XRE-family HTH domain
VKVTQSIGQGFGERMRRRRIEMNMTEEFAAQALGITAAAYRAIEDGRLLLDARTLHQATVAMHRNLSALVDGSEGSHANGR